MLRGGSFHSPSLDSIFFIVHLTHFGKVRVWRGHAVPGISGGRWPAHSTHWLLIIISLTIASNASSSRITSTSGGVVIVLSLVKRRVLGATPNSPTTPGTMITIITHFIGIVSSRGCSWGHRCSRLLTCIRVMRVVIGRYAPWSWDSKKIKSIRTFLRFYVKIV